MTERRARSRSSRAGHPLAAIVAIGDELLAGRTVDTNSGWLAGELTRLGFEVRVQVGASDRVDDIVRALGFASAGKAVVLVSGGLGPTTDDRTFEALAKFLGSPRRLRREVVRTLEQRLGSAGQPVDRANLRQALLPSAASVLPNRSGTAPGASALHRGTRLYVLPGVPSEMKELFAEQVTPDLRRRFGALEADAQTRVRTTGLPEANVAARLAWLTNAHPAAVAFLVSEHGVDVRFPTVLGSRRASTSRNRRVLRSLGPHVFEVGDRSLPEVVLDRLRRAGDSLAVAESCTGGLLGATLTAVAGSSDVFWGGWITYANDAKQRELAVPGRMLARHGAVSVPVACAMARAARLGAGARWGIGITGIAGPGGGSALKPVGTVVIGWSGPRGAARTERYRFEGDRDAIRRAAVTRALDGLRLALESRAVDGTARAR